MRAFVAGATGVIGRELLPRLAAAGHAVTGMTRSESKAADLRRAGFDAVVADALDARAVRDAVAAARPEVIVHQLTALPSDVDPRRYAKQLPPTNRLRREGTAHLVAAASEAGGARIVAQSIAFAYAPEGDWVKAEDAPLALATTSPMGDAVAAVAELERQVLEVGGTVLRYGLFYGPGAGFARDGYYAGLARRRQFPVLGKGDGHWSFVHVADAAEATVASLATGAAAAGRGRSGRVYNIVDDDPAPAREWVPVFARAVGAPRPLRLPLWVGRLAAGPVAVAGMTTQRGASNARARRELGWAPARSSWRQGFAEL